MVDCIACIDIMVLYGIIAISAGMAVIGVYMAKRENNSRYTGLMLFMAAGLWIMIFLANDNIIVGYSDRITSSSQTGGTSIITTSILDQTHTTGDNIASSEKSTVLYDGITGGGASGDSQLFAGSRIREGMTITSGGGLDGDSINSVLVTMLKSGSPAGSVSITVRNSGDVIVASATIPTSTITTSYAQYTAQLNTAVTLGATYKILVEYSGGDASNYVQVQYAGTNVVNGDAIRVHYTASYTNQATNDARFKLMFTNSADFVRDADTNTIWENNQNQESGAYIYADLGTARTSIALKLNYQDTAKIPDSIKLFASNSTASWGSVKDIFTSIKTTGYNTYNFTNEQNARYYKLEVFSWGSVDRWQIAELQIWNGSLMEETETTPIVVTNTYESSPILYSITETKYIFMIIAAMTALLASTTVSVRTGGGFKPFDKL